MSIVAAWGVTLLERGFANLRRDRHGDEPALSDCRAYVEQTGVGHPFNHEAALAG